MDSGRERLLESCFK